MSPHTPGLVSVCADAIVAIDCIAARLHGSVGVLQGHMGRLCKRCCSFGPGSWCWVAVPCCC
jgi:hypothetical protein